MEINYLFFATNVISILVTLGVPIALAVLFIRKHKVSWLVILTGLLTFAISQVLFYFSIRYLSGILQNASIFQGNSIWALVLYALIIGLLSALYVELMRLAGFIFLKKASKSFKSALGFGVGSGAFSGAVQSFFNGGLGLSITIYFFVAVFFNPGALLAKGVDTATVSSMVAQVQQIWAAPWHYGLVLGVESLIMLSVGIVLSSFVWKSVTYHQGMWFTVAVLYHTLFVGIVYYLNMIGWNVWLMEAVLTAFLLVNIYLIYTFWKEESAIEEDEDFAAVEDDEDEDDEDDEDVEDEEISVEEEDTDEIAEVIDQVEEDPSDEEVK